ncbi:MAG: TIGR04255 family protein [Candidatus Scalindua sp.]
MSEKEVFSRAPLTEVIFEIRFAPNLSVACRRDEFYNEIKESYPELILPKISLEQHPLEQAILYRSSDKTNRITCSARSLSFSTPQYVNYEVFKDEFMRIITIFLKKYKTIDKIQRLGLRYINKIQVERKGNKLDLEQYINFKFSLPESLNRLNMAYFQNNFFVEFEDKISGITVIIDNIKDDKNKDILLLDFDLISSREMNLDNIEGYLDKYHNKIEEVFLDIITDNYKKSIR